MELADKTKAELKSVRDDVSGVISIGSGETKSMRLLARWMMEF